MGVGQGHRDDASLVSPESGAVYAGQTPEEVPAVLPGEATDLSPDTPPMSSNYSTTDRVIS
jgi:hypothetical protein